MNNTRWIYKENEIKEDLKSLNLDNDILNILINRKIDSVEKINNFFNNDLDNIISPFSLKDVDKTILRLLEAINNEELIYIYGDYDVDGITSTSIAYLALKSLGAKVDYYIPLRDEGYGLNIDAISSLKEKGAKIIISVDCGITSIKEAKHAKEIGLDLIITDHHEIIGELPNAYAIINPKRKDQDYSFEYLAGCGTIFLLLVALFEHLEKRQEMYKFIDIVAIGTIADIVPLVEENRIFSKIGLNKLKSTENIGLSVLLPLIFEDYKEKEYTSYDVGFLIAPIFNAAGRLEDAKMAVELFVTPSKEIASKIAIKLIEQNTKRKELQGEILEAVEEEITKNKLYEKSVIVSANKDFHHGVIGIVASKIVDKYYKPTIIMEIKENEGFAVASCRSIEGFHILEGLNSMKDLFLKYGGHAGAAGFSIPIENIKIFEEKINEYAHKVIEEENLLKPIKIDKDILFSKISYNFFNRLEDLKPFGFGNANPTFAVKNVKLSNIREIGKDKTHLMLDINYDNLSIRNCVWFGNAHNLENLNDKEYFDIAFKPKIEMYKDKYYPKVFIEDICLSNNSNSEMIFYKELYNTAFPLETIVYSNFDISINDKIEVLLKDNKGYILKNGKSFSFLDDTLSYTLSKLNEYYEYEFTCNLLSVQKSSSNYQIKIRIEKKNEFACLSLKDGGIFKEIKHFLIGSLEYNSMQKNVLSKFFKREENIQIINSCHRGEKTLIYTIALFYKVKEKKCIVITKKENFNKFNRKFCEISEKIEEGYDLYIFYDIKPSQFPEKFIFFNKNDIIKGFSVIDGAIQVPKNIEIIGNKEVEEVILSKYIPNNKKMELMKSSKVIKADDFIYKLI